MKLIIAHVPNDAFEPVRTELTDLGVLRIAMSEVHSTSAEPAITPLPRSASEDPPPNGTEARVCRHRRTVASGHQRPARARGGVWTGRRARSRGTTSGVLGGTGLLRRSSPRCGGPLALPGPFDDRSALRRRSLCDRAAAELPCRSLSTGPRGVARTPRCRFMPRVRRSTTASTQGASKSAISS